MATETRNRFNRAIAKLRKISSKTRINVREVYKKGKSERARIYVIRASKKRYVFRIEHCEPERLVEKTLRIYIAHHIFGMLFPKNAIKVRGVAEVTVKKTPKLGMISEIVRNLHPSFKSYSDDYYGRRKSDLADVAEHKKFVREIGKPTWAEIKKSGIDVNNIDMNVGNVNGTPIYFEISYIHPSLLRNALGKRKITEEAILEALTIPNRYRAIAKKWVKRFISEKDVNIQIE